MNDLRSQLKRARRKKPRRPFDCTKNMLVLGLKETMEKWVRTRGQSPFDGLQFVCQDVLNIHQWLKETKQKAVEFHLFLNLSEPLKTDCYCLRGRPSATVCCKHMKLGVKKSPCSLVSRNRRHGKMRNPVAPCRVSL